MYTLDFTPEAKKLIAKFQKSDVQKRKKLEKVLLDIMEHPRTGIGHPEALKGENDVRYSRRITAHDRIIYDIHDDKVRVLVLTVEGHYDDK